MEKSEQGENLDQAVISYGQEPIKICAEGTDATEEFDVIPTLQHGTKIQIVANNIPVAKIKELASQFYMPKVTKGLSGTVILTVDLSDYHKNYFESLRQPFPQQFSISIYHQSANTDENGRPVINPIAIDFKNGKSYAIKSNLVFNAEFRASFSKLFLPISALDIISGERTEMIDAEPYETYVFNNHKGVKEIFNTCEYFRKKCENYEKKELFYKRAATYLGFFVASGLASHCTYLWLNK